MTARLQLDPTPPPKADVTKPYVYKAQVDLANLLERFIEPMPLDDMAKIATDAAHMALLRKVSAEAIQQMRRDRDTIEILRSAQRQLKQVALRFGE